MADETDQTSSRLPRSVMGIRGGRSHANLRQRFAATNQPFLTCWVWMYLIDADGWPLKTVWCRPIALARDGADMVNV
jgi:hypothetical protein